MKATPPNLGRYNTACGFQRVASGSAMNTRCLAVHSQESAANTIFFALQPPSSLIVLNPKFKLRVLNPKIDPIAAVYFLAQWNGCNLRSSPYQRNKQPCVTPGVSAAMLLLMLCCGWHRISTCPQQTQSVSVVDSM